ncbi:hypothetical protein HY497_00560 [Candidatus Woesearchaeota archaeon]|nr:hypothetical protein [Candidatus Woesearchaeota archaeon]
MLTKTHQLMLYTLGQCYQQLNQRFHDAPLEVSISKVGFIEALLLSGLVGKKERAIYKNLEVLEKQKLISYEDRQLRFTARGYKAFSTVQRTVEPYISHHRFWEANVTLTRKLQARLKG